jgi:endonuclease YncB( thermonuclease family)
MLAAGTPPMYRTFRITCLAAAAASLTGLTGILAATVQEERADTETCTLQAGPTRSVVRVIDSETVLLDDQQEVRLIGALAPRSPDFSPSAEPWAPEEAAIAALKALVQGRSVSIAASGRARDRYGRQLAHLFVEDGSERVWVQGELLVAGLWPARQLRVHARAHGPRACRPRRGCGSLGQRGIRGARRAGDTQSPAAPQFV